MIAELHAERFCPCAIAAEDESRALLREAAAANDSAFTADFLYDEWSLVVDAWDAVEALRRLRLSAEELQRLPLDARSATIQEALGQFVPKAERAAIASQLFGDRAALVFGRIDSATLRQH